MKDNKFKEHISNPEREIQINFLRKIKNNEKFIPKDLKFLEQYFCELDDFARIEFFVTHYHYSKNKMDGYRRFVDALKSEQFRRAKECLTFIISEKIAENPDNKEVLDSIPELCKLGETLPVESRRNLLYGFRFINKCERQEYVKFLDLQKKSNIMYLSKYAKNKT